MLMSSAKAVLRFSNNVAYGPPFHQEKGGPIFNQHFAGVGKMLCKFS